MAKRKNIEDNYNNDDDGYYGEKIIGQNITNDFILTPNQQKKLMDSISQNNNDLEFVISDNTLTVSGNINDNYNKDIEFVIIGDTLTVSGNTNDNTVTNLDLLNKPTTSTKKKDNKKYMAVVRLVKGNQLHTSQIFNDKESLKRWLKKLNIVKSKVIEIDI